MKVEVVLQSRTRTYYPIDTHGVRITDLCRVSNCERQVVTKREETRKREGKREIDSEVQILHEGRYINAAV